MINANYDSLYNDHVDYPHVWWWCRFMVMVIDDYKVDHHHNTYGDDDNLKCYEPLYYEVVNHIQKI